MNKSDRPGSKAPNLPKTSLYLLICTLIIMIITNQSYVLILRSSRYESLVLVGAWIIYFFALPYSSRYCQCDAGRAVRTTSGLEFGTHSLSGSDYFGPVDSRFKRSCSICETHRHKIRAVGWMPESFGKDDNDKM